MQRKSIDLWLCYLLSESFVFVCLSKEGERLRTSVQSGIKLIWGQTADLVRHNLFHFCFYFEISILGFLFESLNGMFFSTLKFCGKYLLSLEVTSPSFPMMLQNKISWGKDRLYAWERPLLTSKSVLWALWRSKGFILPFRCC